MKPDDIPQWAWDEATDVARAWFHEEWNDDEPQDYMQDMLVKYIAQSLAKARSQAFEECEKIADDFHHGYTDQGTEGLYGREAKVCSFISQAIRQHSQKGENE